MKEQTITLPLTPERRKTLTMALREYVDRRYPDSGYEFRRLKIKNVGRRVRQVRAILFALHISEPI